jgi:arabinose-5-phosphate isomerase
MRDIDVIAEVRRVLDLEGEAILKMARSLVDPASAGAIAVAKAVTALRGALEGGGKIVVTGVGKSGKIAQKIAATLCSTGSLSVYLHPTEALHGDLGLLGSKDVVLVLSQTGNTDEVVRLIPSLKSRGVRIVGVGGNGASILATQCDIWILAEVEVEACPHNLAPTTSTTLALAIGDALAMALMRLRGFNAGNFAQNHPGGALGRKLQWKVADLMHRGSEVACVGPASPMDQVVVASTDKKLGAVLVVDGQKLVGIITDGDLRRALQHREKFFQLKAQDVMMRAPISVSPDLMAQSALELMENRSSQISVLPVVNSDGNWLGLIRLHDLVRSL